MADYRISRFVKPQVTTHLMMLATPFVITANRDRVGIYFYPNGNSELTVIGIGYNPAVSGGMQLQYAFVNEVKFTFRDDGSIPQQQFILTTPQDQTLPIVVIELFLPESVLETEMSKYQ